MSEFDPIFGDLKFLREMERNEVKAQRLDLRLKGIERYGGPEVRERVVAALPEEIRNTVLAPPFPSSWPSPSPCDLLYKCLLNCTHIQAQLYE